MMKTTSSLSRSFKLIHSFWFPAMGLYFLEHCSIFGSFGVPAPWNKLIDPLIAFPARIVLLTWVWGMIIAILNDQTATARFCDFKFSIKKAWWIALIAFGIPWGLHFLAFLVIGKEILPIELIKAVSGVGLSYWAAAQFIRIKYAKTVPLPFSGSLFFLTGFLLILSTGLFFTGSLVHGSVLLERLTGLLAIQAQFLAFAAFAGQLLDARPGTTPPSGPGRTLILVNLHGGGTVVEAASSLLRQYPAFFCVLKALTPPGYRFIEYNRIPFWEDRFYQSNALVAITCFTSNCADAYRTAKEFRRRGASVIIGGPHVSFFPEEALEFCDSVVTGAAESIWDEVIRDYENKSLKRIYQGHCPEKEMSRVHQFLMESPVKIAADFIQVNRGCKFNCYFCATRSLLGGVQVEKSLEDTMALITRVSQKKKSLLFLDNNIYANPAYAKKLFAALAPLKLSWGGSASIDIAQDDEALKLLKASGCRMLLIGYEIEAGSAETGKGGKLAFAKDYAALSRKVQQAGIMIKAHFIFGFSGDSWGSLMRLWWSSFRITPVIAGLSFLTPVPGSKFFEDCFREERIINLNWRNYDLCAQVFEHPRLGHPWILRKAFMAVLLLFFLTGSVFGRLIVLFVVVKALFFH